MKKDRNAEVRRNLDSLKCPHPHGADCTDRETGDLFCGDCADVIVPWDKQTERQQHSYRRTFSLTNPPALGGVPRE